MQKTTIDIADLMPDTFLREMNNYLDLYVKKLEAKENKSITYHIEMGSITFELKRLKSNYNFIKKVVLNYFNLSAKKVYWKGEGSRKMEVVYPRQITAYELARHTILKYEIIGEKIGGPEHNYDHATVSHSIKTIKNLCDVEKSVRYDVEKIESLINKKLLGL